jgi:hypothetical protein
MSLYSSKVLVTWSEAKRQLSELGNAWMFRGQRDSRWSLASSLERAAGLAPMDVAEKIVWRIFRRSAHHYLDAQEIPQDDFEWLALMQHHGAPTRLLDFTRSSYVAAFFALESAVREKESSCAVWAINIPWCKVQAVRQIRQIGPDYASLKVFDDIASERMFGEVVLENRRRFVVPVEPTRMNRRLSIQQGLFLAPGDTSVTLERNLEAYKAAESKRKILKFVIPNALRREALEDLYRMNITRTTLFPGLDGFASALNHVLAMFDGNAESIENIRKGKSSGLVQF